MLLEEAISGHLKESIALHGETPVTYGELYEWISHYRAALSDFGVEKGDRVGLYAPNIPEFIYTYFAVISLGAIIVPINCLLTDREVDYIAQDAGLRLIVSSKSLAVSCPCVLLTDLHSKASNMEQQVPVAANRTEDDVCTLIYTSGTTGNPKGAMLTHHNLLANVRSFNQVLPHHEKDNVLCVLPMYHCFGWTTCVLNPLVRGGSITPVASVLPSEILQAVSQHQVTVAFLVPPLYHLLIRAAKPQAMRTVRRYVSGGASLPEPVAKAFEEVYGKPILEGYGLSEASPVVAVNPENGRHKFYSIGPVLPDVEVKIDGYDFQNYEPGKIGELLVRGENVMKGYWNLPEATAKTIRDGWLHTGDLAYLDEERYIYIVDRSKDMIIVNGENVYPREVEDIIYRFPGIAEVAVVGHDDGLRGQSVCAYLVMKEDVIFDKQALRSYLSDHLAGFKIPRKYIVLDALPKNSTGKILKRVLRESDVFRSDAQ